MRAHLTPESELAWLALKMVPGLGAKRGGDLLERYGSPERIFTASRSELEAQGATPQVAQAIASGLQFEEAVTQQQRMRAAGAVLLTRFCPEYPESLASIYDPPFALYARGDLELLSMVKVAVVGTRRPTSYGMVCADKLSRDLANAGICIVSGMARGVDTSAHKAALEVGGKTIAVFGCGVDMVYPTENRKLAVSIKEEGLILSEYPMGTPGYPQNFPVRNRIVSGLSSGVVVIEGAQYSGSAITARLAMDQGREVFAVPGDITRKQSWGPNLLIKQGAKLVQEAQDIVEELPVGERKRLAQMRGEVTDASSGPEQASLFLGPMAPVAREVMKLLSVDVPMSLDMILERLLHRSSSEVLTAVLELELQGVVRQMPGRNFVRVWGVSPVEVGAIQA